MATETFPSKAEAIDFGKDYEFLVAAYYGLIFTFDDRIKNFKISSNNKDMGDFDDVVVELETESGQHHLFAIQLKHVKRLIALVTLTNTKTKNKNFSLPKYCHEFSQVKRLCAKTSPYDANFENFHFVIFTNSVLERCEEIDDVDGKRLEIRDKETTTQSEFTILKSRNSFGYEFLNISDRVDRDEFIYKFKTDKKDSIEEEFFKKLTFYTNQKSAPELENLISKKFLSIFKNCDSNIVVNYLNYFKHWCRRDFDSFKITKDDLRVKFAEYLLEPFIPNADIQNLEFFEEKSIIMLMMIFNFQLTLIRTDSDTTVNKVWGMLLNQFKVLQKTWTELIPSVYLNILTKTVNIPMSAQAENFTEMNLKKAYLFLWHSNILPMFITIGDDSTEVENIRLAFKLCHQTLDQKFRKQFIIMGKVIPEDFFILAGNDCRILQNLLDFQYLPDFYEKLLSLLLVSVQGRTSIPLKNLIQLDEEVAKLFSVNELMEMLDDSFIIGKSSGAESLPDHYVSRSLTRHFLDIEAVNAKGNMNDLYVVSCNDNIDIKEARKYFTTNILELDTYLLLKKSDDSNKYVPKQASVGFLKQIQATTTEISQKFVLFAESLCDNDQFENVCSMNPDKNCHHVRLIDKNRIEWLRTRGSIHNLKPHRLLMSGEIPEGELVKVIKDNQVFSYFVNKLNIVIGDAGWGKSCFLRYLKQNCPIHFMAVKINFNQHVNYFKHPHEVEDDLKYFIDIESTNSFDKTYFNYLSSKKRILFLWDGFDELPRNCMDGAIRAIQRLQSEGYYQWISARSSSQDLLETAFNVLASNITLLTLQEQTQFVFSSLKDVLQDDNQIGTAVKRINENIDTSLRCGYFNYVGIPLHTYMMAEIFKKNPEKFSTQIISLTDIYEEFMEGTFRAVFDKAEADYDNLYVEDIYDNYKRTVLTHLQIAALKSTFDEDIFLSLKLKQDDVDIHDVGVVCGIDEDNRPIFVHKGYKEFLVATWLVDNYPKHPLVLDKIFMDDQLRNVRLMFDMITGKNSPLHLAVLYRKFDVLENHQEDISKVKDSVGRSVLHLACSWGTRHPLLETISRNDERTVVALGSSHAVNKEDDIYLKMLNFLLTENKCDPFDIDDLFKWTCVDYADKTLSLAALETVSKYHNLSLQSLQNYKDIPTLLHYSLRFEYMNLFKMFDDDNIPFVKYENLGNLLQLAIELNNDKFAEILLQNKTYKIAINESTFTNGNPLSSAIYHENYQMIQLLLSNGANIKGHRMPPLAVSASKGNDKICQELIKFGADVNEINVEGNTPLLYAAMFNHVNTMRILLQNGSDVNYAKNNLHPLLCAVQYQSIESLETILEFKPNLDDQSDNLGYSALHHASERGDLSIVRCLLEAGASTKVKSNTLDTPLHVAINKGNPKIAKELVLKDKSVINEYNIHKFTPIGLAALRNFPDIIKQLAGLGADVNSNDSGNPPINCAVCNDFEECVRILIDSGAEVNRVNVDDHVPIFLAKSVSMLTLLLDNSAAIEYRNKFGTTALHFAVNNHRNDIVKELIKRGADVSVKDDDGHDVLHYCFKPNNIEMLEFFLSTSLVKVDDGLVIDAVNMTAPQCLQILLKYGANVNVIDSNNLSALSLAALRKNDCVQILIDNGANPNTDTIFNPLAIAVVVGNLEAVKLLLKHGSDVNQCRALHMSVAKGDIIATVLLIKAGADVNCIDEEEQSPLHAAVGHNTLYSIIAKILVENFVFEDFDIHLHDNYADCVRELIAHGADVNLKEKKQGNTPLHWACEIRMMDVVKILVEAGADVNLTNKVQQTPLHVAYAKDAVLAQFLIKHGAQADAVDADGNIPFYYCLKLMERSYRDKSHTEHDFLDHLKFFQDTGAVDINTPDEQGFTLLHYACIKGATRIVKYLLDNGVNVNSKSQCGNTPIFYAANHNHPEILKILIQHSAEVNVKDNTGNSPLHFAVLENHVDVVKILYECGADIDEKNDDGNAPLHLACFKSLLESAQLLLSLGADCTQRNLKGTTPLLSAISSTNVHLATLLISHGAKIDDEVMFKSVEADNLEIVKLLHESGGNLNATIKEGEIIITLAHIPFIKDFKNTELICYLYDNCDEKIQQEIFQFTCMLGLTECVETILEKGAQVNSPFSDELTPLMCACQNGHLRIVEIFLENGAKISEQTKTGLCAIFFAVYSENLDLVKFLISKNADLNLKDVNGFNLLFYIPATSGKEILEVLVDNGVNISHRTNEGLTVLHEICKSTNTEAVRYLLEKKVDIDAVTVDGNSALHTSVMHENLETVKLLLQNGANVTILNKSELSAMNYAVIQEQLEILEVFAEELQNSKDYQDRDKCNIEKEWEKCLVLASSRNLEITQFLLENKLAPVTSAFPGKITALHRACQVGKTEIIKYLLENGAEVNCLDDTGSSPLYYLCQSTDEVEIVKLLVEKNADVNISNIHGNSGLFAASSRGFLHVVKFLRENGAEVNVEDVDGDLPLHDASFMGHIEVVKFLIENGAHVHHRNKNGKSALDLAVEKEHGLVVEFLKSIL